MLSKWYFMVAMFLILVGGIVLAKWSYAFSDSWYLTLPINGGDPFRWAMQAISGFAISISLGLLIISLVENSEKRQMFTSIVFFLAVALGVSVIYWLFDLLCTLILKKDKRN